MRNDQSKKISEIQLPFQSSDIQADPTQGESESFKKLLELVHTIENAMKSEIELRKLDKATLDNLNERVENTRVQITNFIKVQNELKSKIETPENIKGKSNVEPRFNIDGVAKVKIQEGEENIIKSKENRHWDLHKGRPQMEGRGALCLPFPRNQCVTMKLKFELI